MEYTTFSRSGLSVSRLALGTAPIGDLYAHIGEATATATVRAAYAGGISLFDTSPFYGCGLAELRLGAGLRECEGALSPVISTKIGRRVPGLGETDVPAMPTAFAGGVRHKMTFDYSADGARRSLEQSLLRLGVERIDIVLIHDVDAFTHGADKVDQRYGEAMNGAYRALDTLRAEGVIKAIGVGVNEAAAAARFVTDGDFDAVLLAGRYSLLDQSALQDFLPLALSRGVAVMLGGVFNSGILASGAEGDAKYDYVPAPTAIVDRVRRIETVCHAHGVKLRDAALRFPFGHKAITTVIVGVASEREVRENLSSLDATIPLEFWRDLQGESLLAKDVPVP
jgi:D-threo-aldose 1-dehydrogenase